MAYTALTQAISGQASPAAVVPENWAVSTVPSSLVAISGERGSAGVNRAPGVLGPHMVGNIHRKSGAPKLFAEVSSDCSQGCQLPQIYQSPLVLESRPLGAKLASAHTHKQDFWWSARGRNRKLRSNVYLRYCRVCSNLCCAKAGLRVTRREARETIHAIFGRLGANQLSTPATPARLSPLDT
eukprot:2720346-Amphidinium_carterae.1